MDGRRPALLPPPTRGEKVALVDTEINQAPAGAVEAKDPICGMLVGVAAARYRSEVSGRAVYFCCRQCKETFDSDPRKYLAVLDR